jgi:hypothetical protein
MQYVLIVYQYSCNKMLKVLSYLWTALQIHMFLSWKYPNIRAGLWPSEALSYVKFKRPQNFESQNTHLLFWLKGTLKNKHETDVNESLY